MSFTVLELCSPRKNDARLVVLQLLVFLAVSFQNLYKFSNGVTNLLKKTSRNKEAKFFFVLSSDFPAFTSSSAHELFTCSTILCLV